MGRIHREQPAAALQRESRTIRHQARSETGEVALDERHHVAGAIDDAQVRGVAAVRGQRARCDFRVGARRVDLARAFGRIPLRQQCPGRHVVEGRIADVPRHVGIGQLLRFDERMKRLGGVVPVRAHRRVLDQVEHHQGGDALSVWRQLVHGPPAIRRRERCDPFRVVRREVFGSQRAAVARRAAHEACRDRAPVERVASVCGQQAIARRQIRVSEHLPDARRPSTWQVHPRGFFGGLQEGRTAFPLRRCDLCNRKSFLLRSGLPATAPHQDRDGRTARSASTTPPRRLESSPSEYRSAAWR